MGTTFKNELTCHFQQRYIHVMIGTVIIIYAMLAILILNLSYADRSMARGRHEKNGTFFLENIFQCIRNTNYTRNLVTSFLQEIKM
jgi:hypothetical protein